MKTYQRIVIISEKRTDALGIYQKEIAKSFRSMGTDVKELVFNNSPFHNKFLNFIVEVINSLRSLMMINSGENVLYIDPLSFLAYIGRFISNKKFVVFHHYEQDPFYYKLFPFSSYSSTLNSFDGIICDSKFSLAQIKEIGVDVSKCEVIYCGIDREVFKHRNKNYYSGQYVLSVGSEEPRKNMQIILKSFQMLKKSFPKLKLIKIGKANPANRKRTMSYVNEYRLEDSVVFTNFVSEYELSVYYSNSRLLLFPSLLEGFGLPVVEAMACGCPVVTSDLDPMKELAGRVCVLVDPQDPEEIYNACSRIISDEDYRQSLVKKGLERSKRFDWDRTARDINHFLAIRSRLGV
jgi:glycosyltransferase involved in cell wall biosynthesis